MSAPPFRTASIIAAGLAAVLAFAETRPAAVTRSASADGEFWDVQDTSPWSQDSGGIATGGRAMPFNGFGYLKLQVRRADSTLLVRNHYLAGFGLASDRAGHFDSIRPALRADVVVSRALYARLEGHGPIGQVAMNLFRACKTSQRAKVYRGRRYRGAAYDTKQYSMDLLCAHLVDHAPTIGLSSWGWREDSDQPVHRQVLYIDLPTGQISFHTG